MIVDDSFRAGQIDGKRRVTLPWNAPKCAPVQVETLAENVWLVRLVKPSTDVRLIGIPTVPRLADDPEMAGLEAAAAKSLAAHRYPQPQ